MTPTNQYFTRAALKGDMLYFIFRFRDIEITISKRTGDVTKIEDEIVNRLLCEGCISAEQQREYEDRISDFFRPERALEIDAYPMEQIYDSLNRIRCDVFGAEILEQERERQMQERPDFSPECGIDQRQLKEELVCKASSVTFVMTEARLFSVMKEEMEKVLAAGKKVHLVVSPERQKLFPSGEDMEKSLLLWFGEEGFFYCRNLPCDSVVFATPCGYHAQAVTGQLGMKRDTVVYIPAGFDIAPYVPLIDRTRLDFRVLYSLWKQYGVEIYSKTPEKLYQEYPEAFVNIYGNQLPIQVELDGESDDVFACFDLAKEKRIRGFLQQFKNIKYVSAYLEEEGVRVDGVRINRSKKAEVIPCGDKAVFRDVFSERGIGETGIVSNFMFFMTKKLVHLYNDLRKDRPEEMSDKIMGYLDYQLEYRDGRRVETFPLFRKNCIAMKNTGEMVMFQFRLGGGSVSFNNISVRWEKEDVDPEEQLETSEICVFTPYISQKDTEYERETYRNLVGENRLNFVIYQDQILCCRMGDVVQPSIGVVLSLEKEKGNKLIEQLGLLPLGNGYYDVTEISLSVRLDKPEEVTDEDWKQIKWAYGGGMSLISDGKLFDNETEFLAEITKAGWASPLSHQTQESELQKFAKHPRTAIGTTKDGSLIILVYSGRTRYSGGADYREMVQIARRMFPDIQYLMNVDGGGSAVLGLVHDGTFMELSIPSTSKDNTVGMARPVNTVLYVPIEK